MYGKVWNIECCFLQQKGLPAAEQTIECKDNNQQRHTFMLDFGYIFSMAEQ